MSNKLILKLTAQSMKLRKQVIFPYILASILLFSMEYVMISLIGNKYVQSRHEILPTLMTIAAFVCSIFTVIFILYAYKFIRKNQYKELGLYSVLGLEKKHLKKMMTYESVFIFIVVTPLSIVLGYLFGVMSFMFINMLMRDTGASIMQYPFSSSACVLTILLTILTTLISRVLAGLKIRKSNIRDLFESAKNNEKEPKSRMILSVLGLILLGIGYYISLTTLDPLVGIVRFFIAILLVIVATYLLFVSLSIVLLKKLKLNKKYYLKSSNFLTVSGMLYRMKSNAISLAGISILCTGLIITIGTTTAVYFSLNDKISEHISEQYLVNNMDEAHFNSLIKEFKSNLKIKSKKVQKKVRVASLYKNNEFKFLEKPKDNKKINFADISYLVIEPLSSYNSYQDKKINLKSNEILLGTNIKEFDYDKKVKFNGKKYSVVKIDSNKELARFAVNGFYIVANDQEANNMREFFRELVNEKEYAEQPYIYDLQFSLSNNSLNNQKKLDKILKKYNLRYETEEMIKRGYYSINGGFLSLGIMVSIIMLIGTALMLYYKQISEGYADKNKFAIMKQVGLEDELIKKTIKKQVLWVFVLPIVVAIVHTTFAFNLLSKLLIVFGMRDMLQLAIIYGVVTLICLVIYGLFYKMTSRVYYSIVK